MRKKPSRTVKLFVRLDPEAGLETQKEQTIERLIEMSQNGWIDDYDLYVWGKEIRPDGPLERTPYCRELLDHISAFREWVESSDNTQTPFSDRAVRSELADEAYEVISLPAMCLAIYENDELVDVYPRREVDEMKTVLDGLTHLEKQLLQTNG